MEEEFGFLKEFKKKSNENILFLKKVCEMSNTSAGLISEKTKPLPLNSMFHVVIDSQNLAAQKFLNSNHSEPGNCSCHSKTIFVVDDGDAGIILILCCKINLYWRQNSKISIDQDIPQEVDMAGSGNVKPITTQHESFFIATETVSTVNQTEDILSLLKMKKMNIENNQKKPKITKTPHKADSRNGIAMKSDLNFFSVIQGFNIEWFCRPNTLDYDDDDDEEAIVGTLDESSYEMKLFHKYLNDPDLNTSKIHLDKIICDFKNNYNSSSEENGDEEYESNPIKTTMSFSNLINEDIWTRESIMKYGGSPLWVYDDDISLKDMCACNDTLKNPRFVFQLLPSLWQSFPKEFAPWTVDWSSVYIFQCQNCYSYFLIVQSL